MSCRVIFSPEAEDQLIALYNYIADAASPDIAKHYTDGIIAYCEGLNIFPLRGTLREDIRPDLRITNYKKRTVIAFEVDEKIGLVSILGLFYGGQDFGSALMSVPDID